MKRKEVIYEFGSFIIFNFIYLHCSLTHPYWNNQENRDWNHSYFLLYLNGWSLSAAVFFSQLEIFLFLISVWYLHTWLSPTYSSVGDIFALSWMLLQKNWMQGLIFFFKLCKFYHYLNSPFYLSCINICKFRANTLPPLYCFMSPFLHIDAHPSVE